MDFEIFQIPCLADNYSYAIVQKSQNRALIVDPTDGQTVSRELSARNLELEGILCTHHHADHVGGIPSLLASRYFSPEFPVMASEKDGSQILQCNRRFGPDEIFKWRGLEIQGLAIPGHTHGHMAFYISTLASVFTGDTLFSNGCGRLFEGTFQEMFSSLQKLKALPLETQIYCGHEYTEVNTRFAQWIDPENPEIRIRLEEVQGLRKLGRPTIPVSLKRELQTNPFLRASSVEEFRRTRDLRSAFRG